MLRQYLRRLKHSKGQQQTLAAIAGLWMTTFTLWHYKEAVRNNVRSGFYSKRGPVHQVVEKWHLDGDKLPVLNSMRDEK